MNSSNEIKTVLEEKLADHRNEEEHLDVNFKSPLCDNETNFDPLQEPAALSPNFPWLFNDENILQQNENLVDMVFKSTRGRGRRKRTLNTNNIFPSNIDFIWTLENDVPATSQDEVVLTRHQACGKGPARTVTNAVESWMLLFDDEMLRMLLRLVNENIRNQRSRSHIERPTDLTELRSWLGLCFLCGVFRNSPHNGPLEELWTVELGNAIFRATMSLARFEFLTTCVNDLNESNWNDANRLWQKLLINCRSYYGPSCWICVDEVRGIENMPLMICCDAKTQYMTNALLSKQQQTPSKRLLQLLCDYKTTSRNITICSQYASLRHCEQLLQCNLSSICMLPPTAPEYPLNWSGVALKKGANKLTQQSGGALLTSGLSNHVNSEQIYKFTSQVCTDFHEFSAKYSTTFSAPTPQTNFFLQLLHLILNISSFNAWVLLRLSSKGDPSIEQRDFQRQLGLFLTQQRLQRLLHRRSACTTLGMRLQICEILGLSSQRLLSEASRSGKQSNELGVISLASTGIPEGVALVSRYGEKHRRCKPCTRNKRVTKARSRCQQCQEHRCGNHLISRCYECMGLTTPQLPVSTNNDG